MNWNTYFQFFHWIILFFYTIFQTQIMIIHWTFINQVDILSYIVYNVYSQKRKANSKQTKEDLDAVIVFQFLQQWFVFIRRSCSMALSLVANVRIIFRINGFLTGYFMWFYSICTNISSRLFYEFSHFRITFKEMIFTILNVFIFY